VPLAVFYTLSRIFLNGFRFISNISSTMVLKIGPNRVELKAAPHDCRAEPDREMATVGIRN
jgi:hypothetical protein